MKNTAQPCALFSFVGVPHTLCQVQVNHFIAPVELTSWKPDLCECPITKFDDSIDKTIIEIWCKSIPGFTKKIKESNDI